VEEETALAVDAYLLEPRPRLGMPPGRGQGCGEGRVTPGRECQRTPLRAVLPDHLPLL